MAEQNVLPGKMADLKIEKFIYSEIQVIKRKNKKGNNKRHAQKEERLGISFSSISGESAEEERRFISALWNIDRK